MEHYWKVDFPNTEECIKRGYGGVLTQNDRDDPIKARPRRKRHLQIRINDKENYDNVWNIKS